MKIIVNNMVLALLMSRKVSVKLLHSYVSSLVYEMKILWFLLNFLRMLFRE